MVISWVERQSEAGTAWGRVEEAQRELRLPCLLVPQPAHAVFAGELATALLPSAFGQLPREIERAIQLHDSGWAASDAQQIQRLRAPGGQTGKPLSFLAVAADEAREAWTASIDTVEAITQVGAIVVSRHFMALAGQAETHHNFIQAETRRRQRLEGATLSSGQRPGEADLDRWTAALVFCDLLSLYLLSGATGVVDLPLGSTNTRLNVEDRNLRFSTPALRPGCAFSVHALKHPLHADGPRVEALRWQST